MSARAGQGLESFATLVLHTSKPWTVDPEFSMSVLISTSTFVSVFTSTPTSTSAFISMLTSVSVQTHMCTFARESWAPGIVAVQHARVSAFPSEGSGCYLVLKL